MCMSEALRGGGSCLFSSGGSAKLMLPKITVKFKCSISQAVTLKAMKVLSFLLGLAYPSGHPSNLL